MRRFSTSRCDAQYQQQLQPHRAPCPFTPKIHPKNRHQVEFRAAADAADHPASTSPPAADCRSQLMQQTGQRSHTPGQGSDGCRLHNPKEKRKEKTSKQQPAQCILRAGVWSTTVRHRCGSDMFSKLVTVQIQK